MPRVTCVNPPSAPKVQGPNSHVAVAEPDRTAVIASAIARLP